MNIQYIIVIAIIFAAVVYAGAMLRKKARSFSVKKTCNTGCGCNGAKEKLT
ncbi:MAG: FeoB-associated Cys-rich membrane protein [Blastocatellia bacterium]